MVTTDDHDTPQMTMDEIKHLMLVMAHYDGRERGRSDAMALSEAARRAGWTLAEAEDAVHEHFAYATGRDSWILPGHITAGIRARRRANAEQQHSRQVTADAARMIASGGDDPHGGRRNSPELESLHTEAMTEPCGYCHVDVGQRCRNPITGNAAKIPHTQRSKAARDRIERGGGRSVFRL